MAIFKFKQFDLEIDKDVFPITTDAILLSAWINCSESDRILEVGIGSGVISFVCKNRFPNSIIHGIDINAQAVKSAILNVKRLHLANITFSESSFHSFEHEHLFDHIVSNPPYFEKSLLPLSELRLNSKHRKQFDMIEFANFCKNSLKNNGKVSLVLPLNQENMLSSIMLQKGFKNSRITRISHQIHSLQHLVLLEYSLPYDSVVVMNRWLYEQSINVKSDWYESLIKEILL